MINTFGGILITAFVAILIGIALIQPVANNAELAKISSITVSNESVTLTAVTQAITNESVAMSATGLLSTATLGHKYMATLTGLRNCSGASASIIQSCNITLSSAFLSCSNNNNITNTTCADYTYYAYQTGQLVNNELLSFDSCKNSTTQQPLKINEVCNVTLASGAVKVTTNNSVVSSVYIEYKYEPDTYVGSSTSSSILTLVILFFVIGILAVGIGAAIKAFKEGGIM